jgi:hypothetical protein
MALTETSADELDEVVGAGGHNPMMRTFVAAAAAALAVLTAPLAHADPSPPLPIVPTPGGPWLPSAEAWPPICAAMPMACSLRYDPSTGTWQPRS